MNINTELYKEGSMGIEQIERIVKDALEPCSTQILRELVVLAENVEDKETGELFTGWLMDILKKRGA